jgi:hypothetical protein
MPRDGKGGWRNGEEKLAAAGATTCRIGPYRLRSTAGFRATTRSPPRATWNGFSPMANYSKYQQKVIKNYYNNQEAILLQRLGEQVTELYLAEGKARVKRWKDITKSLEKLKVPASRIENLNKQDNPALLAKLLEELLAKQK